MGFVLWNTRASSLCVDCWTWGAFHAVVTAARVLPEAIWGPLRFNAGGALPAAEVRRLAAFAEAVMLPLLRPGERLLLDGTVTSEPERDGAVVEAEDEAWRAYTLSHEGLVRILGFLKAASGSVFID